jgi:predicted DNA binding protein
MSLIAEFSQLAQALREATEQFPAMSFELEDHHSRGDGTTKFLLWAEGRSSEQFDAFENELHADETVRTAEHLTTLGSRRYYSVILTEAATRSLTFGLAAANDIVYLDIQTTKDRVHFTARVPDRAAIKRYRQECQERGVDFRLEGLYAEDDEAATRFGLTERQGNALVSAYESGYYDTPRRTTLDELATEFGISRQAVSTLLRRGHRQLIGTTLAD